MRKLASIIPTASAVVVALASFVLSFVALRDVAAAVGAVPPNLAWLLPLVVDGGVLAGSASLWGASYRKVKRDKVAYLTVAVLLAFSVIVNMSHAGSTPLAKAIAALPPIVLLACLELVAAQHREVVVEKVRAARSPQAPRAAATAPTKAAAPSDPAIDQPSQQLTAAVEPPLAPASERSQTSVNMAEAIRAEFDKHLLDGGNPSDPRLASDIAARLDVTPAYVRRLIKPLREESLIR